MAAIHYLSSPLPLADGLATRWPAGTIRHADVQWCTFDYCYCKDIDKVSKAVLVIDPNAPVRARITRALRERDLEPHEAVGIDDALYFLTRNGIPASIVVADKLGEQSGLGLIKGLTRIERTKFIPTVVVAETEAGVQSIRNSDLPSTVIAVVKQNDVTPLVDAILAAHAEASEHVPEDFKELQKQSSESLDVGPNKSLDQIEIALQALDDVLKRVVKGKLPGPMMPEVLEQVRALTKRPDLEFPDIADMVGKHQSLSGKLLSVANSAYYSRRGKAENIMQALSRLGLNKTIPLLQALAAREFIVGDHKLLRKLISESLRKAYLVGVVAEELATFDSYSDPSQAYSLGLFHNIGGTFLLYTIALLHQQKKMEVPRSKALLTVVDSHAGKLNRSVASAMGLPKEIEQVFPASDDEEPPTLVTYVQQAMFLGDKVLDPALQTIELDADAELLGLNQRIIDFINDKRTQLTGLMAAYSR